MKIIICLIVIYWLRRLYIINKINSRIDHSKRIIENCIYTRYNTPWWTRTDYYINGEKIEACDYWKNYHSNRVRRLDKVLDNQYKYLQLIVWYVRKFYRTTNKFIHSKPKLV